ncbi:hypothetical protein [Pseudoalteromonas ostreae]|uniref:hypothetical protein n=1 Tax=Pseudoalteromonas ostreae TaxID=2774154 RepID=UPI001E511EA0|nr:hypothetical protein [Pseudoalteromonas ostreae]
MVASLFLITSSQFVNATTYQMTTPANDDGQGNFVFFDRHFVDCGSDAINSLHLIRPSAAQIAYEYGCTVLSNAINNNVYTPANDDGGGNVIFLDRHTVNCEDKALQYLHLQRVTASTVQYHYQCSDKRLSNVNDYFTPANEDGSGNAIYLDRHNVSCPASQVLSYLRLERPTANTMRYHYKCGTYNEATTYGFTDAYAAPYWSITGVATANMSESALSASVNYGGGVTASITIPESGAINFDWNMTISSAGQYGDVIRYVINGVNYDLSTAGSASGAAENIAVSSGDIFEFLTWGTTKSSSYNATFSNFSFVPDTTMIHPQCAFFGDNQGRNDAGFTGQTFVYHNSSYGSDRFMWDGISKGEVPIGTDSVTDAEGNVFTLGAQVSHPYSDLWYYEICANMPQQ